MCCLKSTAYSPVETRFDGKSLKTALVPWQQIRSSSCCHLKWKRIGTVLFEVIPTGADAKAIARRRRRSWRSWADASLDREEGVRLWCPPYMERYPSCAVDFPVGWHREPNCPNYALSDIIPRRDRFRPWPSLAVLQTSSISISAAIYLVWAANWSLVCPKIFHIPGDVLWIFLIVWMF